MLDRFPYISQIIGIRGRERVNVLTGQDRILDHRPFITDVTKLQTHRLNRQQQVGEDDRGVHIQRFDRLQRYGCRQIGTLTDLEEGMFSSDIAVRFHVPARLTHKPDRPHVGRTSAAGIKKSARHRGNTHG